MAAAWARSISRRLAPPQAQHQPAIQREKGTTWCEKVGVQSTPGGVRLSSLSILVQNFPHTSGAEKCNVSQKAARRDSFPRRGRIATVCAGKPGLHAQAGEAAGVLPVDPLLVEHLPGAPAPGPPFRERGSGVA